MGSDLKEMKYRRRIGVEERPQCSDPRGVDWAALQQDPVELLRKLDELRDQITRSCHVVGPPREHRRSRRAVSLIPEQPETPPLAGYHRSRYGGRYGHSLPPSPYSPARPEHGERYVRQSSGHYRQFPGRQWENGGIGPVGYHHYSCTCPHCLHAQRAPPPEENIPMARYFAGQHESYRFERSPSISSDYDRRSVGSSLYSHRSVSKRRAEYFRKKAEHLCRPVDGAAPFVVCSSCYQLLQMPMEKCILRKQNRLQCGSCCQVVNLKREEESGIPFTQSTSLYEPEMEQRSSDQMRRDGANQIHNDFNSVFYRSNEHSSIQINTDFADDNSFSSTVSRDRTEKECGSSRSIQSKADDLSFSSRRSVDVGSPKDILCERDADFKAEPPLDYPSSLHSPVLEDKLVDPLCTQEKDSSGEDQSLAYSLDLTSKGQYDVNDGENVIAGKQKDIERDTNATEDESSHKSHEQTSKEDNCCNAEHDDNMYEQDSGKDDIGGLEDGIEKVERENNIYDTDNTNVEHMSKNNEQKSEGDGECALEVETINNNGEKSKEDVNDTLESTSRGERCEELKMEEHDGKLQQPFVEDASSLEESGSSVNGRTNSGFSRGSSETGLDEDQSSTGKSGDSSFFAGFLKKGFKDLSLFNQSMDNVKVSINGHPISERALKKAEKKAGPVEPGSYWYDYRAGFWGVMGHECIGIIPPFIREFNYPIARNCAGGDTGVLVNGRELHQRDLDLLVGRGLPRISGKSYSVEISGNITEEATGKKLRTLGKLAPTNTAMANEELAALPPRGWNSYDSFTWTVDENAYLQNAQIMAEKLLSHGYQFAVIDFLWYRKYVDGAYENSCGFDNIDEWGRPFPDLQRFPSSKIDRGFSQIASKVHQMGLKFGIHLMNGISKQAVDSNTPILDIKTGKPYMEDGRQWTASDIGLTQRKCAWMNCGFMSVNTDIGAGKAFLRSLYRQYADWGVDFVKVDCIFGTDYSPNEIIAISEVLQELDRPIILSLSPGTGATPALAENISEHVNMYRITGDDWDKWDDVSSHFSVSSAFAAAKKIGATGLRGRSWPDLDMLPFGWLTDTSVNQGPYRKCNLTIHEQKTQMALWSIAKSPLMYGGDLRHLDESTFSIITNPTLLKINHYSQNNMEFRYIYGEGTSSEKYPNLFRSPYHNHFTKNNVMEVGLTACSDDKANGWYMFRQDGKPDHICRNYEMNTDKNISFCLGKTKPPLASDDIIMDKEYQEKFHLRLKKVNTCLDASAAQSRTASETRTRMFSRCSWHAKQMWELNEKGNLVSSYSRLCATVVSRQEGGTAGVRAWVATGSQGEIYLALFNLDIESRKLSAKISDLRKVLGATFIRRNRCTCMEVWSGKDYGLVEEEISGVVNPHGSLVFELKC